MKFTFGAVFLKRLSLTQKLYALGFLLTGIIAALLFIELRNSGEELNRAHLAGLANHLADEVIDTSGAAARERGFTGVALATAGSDHAKAQAEKIRQIRASSDAGFDSVHKLAVSILELDPANIKFKAEFDALLAIRKEFLEMREKVDAELNGKAGSLTRAQWIDSVTKLITGMANLRMAALRPSTAVEIALEASLRTKHLVWLISEFAGRERGNLGPVIADRKPVTPELMVSLSSWRATVEQSIQELQAIKLNPNLDPEIKTTIEKMEAQFVTKWGERRSKVLAAAATGQYPLTSEEWVSEATVAIDSVLAVSTAVSQSTNKSLSMRGAEIKTERTVAWLTVAIVVFCLGFSFQVIQSHIVRPLRLTMESLSHSSVRVADVSDEVASSSSKLSKVSQDQASSIVQTASAMEELSSMVHRNSSGAQVAATVSVESEDAAKRGLQIVEELEHSIEAMREATVLILSEVERGSQRMSEVSTLILGIRERTKAIDDIVFQTKLLSFNASVEAARAGEAGRGFAVVAEEVGALVQRSGSASHEISDVISDSVKRVESIAKEMRETVNRLSTDANRRMEEGRTIALQGHTAMTEILNGAVKVRQLTDDIKAGSTEQAAGIEQINQAVHLLEKATSVNTTVSGDAATAAENLKSEAHSLENLIASLETVIEGEGKSAA